MDDFKWPAIMFAVLFVAMGSAMAITSWAEAYEKAAAMEHGYEQNDKGHWVKVEAE